MIRRPLRPSFSIDDRKRLIEAMGRARDLVCHYSSAHGYGSPEDVLADAFQKATDDLAEHLTGDRQLFWSKGFSHLATPAPGHGRKSDGSG